MCFILLGFHSILRGFLRFFDFEFDLEGLGQRQSFLVTNWEETEQVFIDAVIANG